MCGIFGGVTQGHIPNRTLKVLALDAKRRGSDASGLFYYTSAQQYSAIKSVEPIDSLVKKNLGNVNGFFMGHSRLITHSPEENQPVILDEIAVIHNGIILNDHHLWSNYKQPPIGELDSNVLPMITSELLKGDIPLEQIAQQILQDCIGVVNCAIAIPSIGKLLLISNNGSLFVGQYNKGLLFSSERTTLVKLGCSSISQIADFLELDIPTGAIKGVSIGNDPGRVKIASLPSKDKVQENLLENPTVYIRRCSNCILPETMPFINFNEEGVCNFCLNHKKRNPTHGPELLLELLKDYRRAAGPEVIIPFSGGRDSSYALHIAVKQLGLKPIAFTYDWGMLTDLGRRNASLMCSTLRVENIVVAANIERKRLYIRKNLLAWLNKPHLGLLSLLTSGDKHFFRLTNQVCNQTGVSLQLWGTNPLEVTHFKQGFLGIPPKFGSEQVFAAGIKSQVNYQTKRFLKMSQSPRYFNSSIWDTLSGEFHRSISKKSDYLELFNHFLWNEKEVEYVLDEYGWERSVDTRTTWRIGDGTAAFYNYIYSTVAGFTEHDTFRSNQIREGDLTREKALTLVESENTPRYQNIKWYLDILGIDFASTINKINSIPKLY
jgi:glucosamine--fructose-6-phosphate aminotransferase (isomerizing)